MVIDRDLLRRHEAGFGANPRGVTSAYGKERLPVPSERAHDS
jgi:hypothetical protein